MFLANFSAFTYIKVFLRHIQTYSAPCVIISHIHNLAIIWTLAYLEPVI